jgi:YD repeat-containing protein
MIGSFVWSGAHRLTTFTASNGVTTTLDYDSLGRITRRYTALGYSDYVYEDGTDWLVRETWHSAISGNSTMHKIDNVLNMSRIVKQMTPAVDDSTAGVIRSLKIGYGSKGGIRSCATILQRVHSALWVRKV